MSNQTKPVKQPKAATLKKKKEITFSDFDLPPGTALGPAREKKIKENIHDLAKLQVFIATGAKITDIRDALIIEANGRANRSILNRLVGRFGSMLRDDLARKVGLEGRKLVKTAKVAPALTIDSVI